MGIEAVLNGHALYICYFGLREPLVQTQVLPYLRELRDGGMKISILTFETNPPETWTNSDIETEKNKLGDEGIDWHFLTYHKTPTVPATVYDVFRGAMFTRKFIRNNKIDIIHARVHVPALMGALAKKFSGKKTKLLFDIRGFFPEEYTDAGRWKENGLIYRAVKRVEKWLLKESDGFVVLTEKAREILFPESKTTGVDKAGRPVEVIPCCVDLERFRQVDQGFQKEFRETHNLDDRLVIAYVGAFGGWYLTRETVDFLAVAKQKRPDTFALILTQSPKDEVIDLLTEAGFSGEDYWIDKVAPSEIPNYLSVADFGLSFIKACYSKKSSSPTKNAEYFASGLPILANSGVGDTAEFTLEDGVGVIIDEFNEETYFEAFAEMLALIDSKALISERCRKSALARFDLKLVGGANYRRIYEKLLEQK